MAQAGDESAAQRDASGERRQATVLLSRAAYRLVQGLVEASPAGEHQIKGKSEPRRVFRLEAICSDAARFDAALSRGPTAYVGRDRELALLDRVVDCAKVEAIDVVAEAG